MGRKKRSAFVQARQHGKRAALEAMQAELRANPEPCDVCGCWPCLHTQDGQWDWGDPEFD